MEPQLQPMQPQLDSRQDFFSRQDQPNFSSQGSDDSPRMFSQGLMHDGGFDMIGTLLFLALLFVMARFFFGGMRHAMLGHGPSQGWQHMKNMRRGWGQDNALELARMRFAKGELSSEEFEMIQSALKD
jgi:uncharacterized membrane protein